MGVYFADTGSALNGFTLALYLAGQVWVNAQRKQCLGCTCALVTFGDSSRDCRRKILRGLKSEPPEADIRVSILDSRRPHPEYGVRSHMARLSAWPPL
jgi:hypothetical protein